MPPTKLDYCIARFGRKRRYTTRLSSYHLLASPPGFSKRWQLLPRIPLALVGIHLEKSPRLRDAMRANRDMRSINYPAQSVLGWRLAPSLEELPVSALPKTRTGNTTHLLPSSTPSPASSQTIPDHTRYPSLSVLSHGANSWFSERRLPL